MGAQKRIAPGWLIPRGARSQQPVLREELLKDPHAWSGQPAEIGLPVIFWLVMISRLRWRDYLHRWLNAF